MAAVYLTGAAPAAVDADNARLRVPAADGGQENGPTLSVVPAQNVVPPSFEIGRSHISTNGTVSVKAVGVRTADVVCRAVLILYSLVLVN